MRTRQIVPLSAALIGVAALSGCSLTAEIANLEPYDPSDGVGVTLGDVAVRNALLITADGSEANLVMSVVNNSGQPVDLLVQYGPVDARVTETISLPATPALSQIGSDPANQLLLEDDDIVAGALLEVYFQHGSVQGEVVNVPVLDGSLAEYELLVP